MKRSFFFLIQIFLSYSIYSQQFVSKKWDARFGGTALDEMEIVAQTTDGGYVLAGYSISGISGNKTQADIGDDDYWIVKIDASGHYLWDKTYGGPGPDAVSNLSATKDGGCIVGGGTASDSCADISQPSWGGYDYWVVKLDASGHKQWDRRYGGSGDDFLYSVKLTKDGGYILAGISSSGISGDRTQPNWDTTNSTGDYWIVKIDSLGNKQWDKRFGTIQDDACNDVIQTPDGGYLIGGVSPDIDTSGDKTHANFSTLNPNYWVIKIDSSGNKQWDNVFGGQYGENFGNSLNASGGGYVLGGTSDDAVSGDKTTALCGYWLVKIDTLGNKQGDWSYGSSNNSTGSGGCGDNFGNMTQTNDGGYLLTGTSGSPAGGDKTENNLGFIQVWTIKIDSEMNRVWDKTELTTTRLEDYPCGVFENSSGCYIIGVSTEAGIGGDKTQSNWDPTDQTQDYWVVEYCDSFSLGIGQPEGAMHLLVYPNPTAADLYINIQKDDLAEAAFTLTSATGQAVYQAVADHLAHSYTKIIDLSALPAGVYMLTVTVAGERIVKKIVKE